MYVLYLHTLRLGAKSKSEEGEERERERQRQRERQREREREDGSKQQRPSLSKEIDSFTQIQQTGTITASFALHCNVWKLF